MIEDRFTSPGICGVDICDGCGKEIKVGEQEIVYMDPNIGSIGPEYCFHDNDHCEWLLNGIDITYCEEHSTRDYDCHYVTVYSPLSKNANKRVN